MTAGDGGFEWLLSSLRGYHGARQPTGQHFLGDKGYFSVDALEPHNMLRCEPVFHFFFKLELSFIEE